MSESEKTPKLHPANEVIAKLYSTVIDNKNMLDFFAAWDSYAEHVFKDRPEEAEIWQPLLIEHFEQASSLVVVKQPSMAEEKQAFVDRQQFPTLLFNPRFRLVARNKLAKEMWPLELDSDISNAIMPPFAPNIISSGAATPIEQTEPILVSLQTKSADQTNILMGVIHAIEFTTGDRQAKELLFILRIAQPRWFPKLGRMLSSTYGLTDSEIEIARGLHQNKSLNSIAKERERSVRTVRTQLSHVFEKTGTSSQAELISMISNLGQILDSGKNTDKNSEPSRGHSNRNNLLVKSCTSSEGHQLSYLIFGDQSGQKVLSIQPTVPPELTERFRRVARENGVYFIVPYKPGSGQSSSRNYSYTPELASGDYKSILDAEGINSATILGIYSGGIYALEFANAFPNSVDKLVLADTGVPLNLPLDFMKMSPSARRTFLPARLSPSVLLAPHKMVAKEFHDSVKGQRKIIEYFFKGSPEDQKLVNQNKEFYDITRDMIQYSFEDIKQLVDDVCLWAGNWRKTMETAVKTHQLHFLHGECNDVFMWNAVKSFAAKEPKAQATQLKGRSQLGIFADPEKLMQTLTKQ